MKPIIKNSKIMRDYTNNLSALQLIEYIANDYLELSQEKIEWQRNEHMQICRDWLDHLRMKPHVATGGGGLLPAEYGGAGGGGGGVC